MASSPSTWGTFEMAEKNFKPRLTKVKQANADVIVTWTLDFVVAQMAAARPAAWLPA